MVSHVRRARRPLVVADVWRVRYDEIKRPLFIDPKRLKERPNANLYCVLNAVADEVPTGKVGRFGHEFSRHDPRLCSGFGGDTLIDRRAYFGHRRSPPPCLGASGPVELSDQGHRNAPRTRANFQHTRRLTTSQARHCRVNQRLRRWAWNQRRPINLKGTTMEPRFPEDVLERLMRARTANPRSQAFPLLCSRRSIGLHIEPRAFTPNRPGEQQLRAEARRVDTLLGEPRGDPIKQRTSGPVGLRS